MFQEEVLLLPGHLGFFSNSAFPQMLGYPKIEL